MIIRTISKALLVFVMAVIVASPATAQEEVGGEGGNQGTGTINVANDPALVNEVVNQDGSINFDGMVDLGIVTDPNATYMYTIPVINTQIPATYHQYMTPSGALVLIPTFPTLLGLNYNGGLNLENLPDGYYNPSSAIVSEAGLDTPDGITASISPGGSVSLPNTAGYYTYGDDSTLQVDPMSVMLSTMLDYQGLTAGGMYAQIVNWYNTSEDLASMTQQDLVGMSFDDFMNGGWAQFYAAGPGNTTILIYTDCTKSPIGCPETYNAAVTASIPDVVYIPAQCPPPYTTTGSILIDGGPGAGDGGKIAPVHPIVVGQDPQRRGVDVQAHVVIPPVIYHYFEALPMTRMVCLQDDLHGVYGTGCTPSTKRFRVITEHYYDCEEYTRSYVDQLGSATLSLTLTQESRQWILTSLEQAYPGAHLLHPDFGFSFPGPGSESGGAVSWTHLFTGIPLQDPGYWAVSVRVVTTGTPVSGARFATGSLGTFLVELVRVTLVDGMGGNQP